MLYSPYRSYCIFSYSPHAFRRARLGALYTDHRSVCVSAADTRCTLSGARTACRRGFDVCTRPKGRYEPLQIHLYTFKRDTGRSL